VVRARAPLTAHVVVSALAVVLAAGPALASPDAPVPSDVTAVLDDGLRMAQAGQLGVDDAFSGEIRADAVHEVFQFSPAFVQGERTNQPVVTTRSWVASIMRGDQVLGTLLVQWPEEAPAEPVGYSRDVVLGTVLGTLSATELLIDDAPNGAYYALDGTTVRPLNDWAEHNLAGPAELPVLQEMVAEQHAVAVEEEAVQDYPSVRTLSLMGMAFALLAGVSLAIHAARRRRRAGVAAPYA
jgi:hypothetical protein